MIFHSSIWLFPGKYDRPLHRHPLTPCITLFHLHSLRIYEKKKNFAFYTTRSLKHRYQCNNFLQDTKKKGEIADNVFYRTSYDINFRIIKIQNSME